MSRLLAKTANEHVFVELGQHINKLHVNPVSLNGKHDYSVKKKNELPRSLETGQESPSKPSITVDPPVVTYRIKRCEELTDLIDVIECHKHLMTIAHCGIAWSHIALCLHVSPAIDDQHHRNSSDNQYIRPLTSLLIPITLNLLPNSCAIDVAQIVWGIAHAKLRLCESILKALSLSVCNVANAMTTQQLSMTLWGLACLKVDLTKQEHQVLAKAIDIATPQFAPQGVANVLWALSRLPGSPFPSDCILGLVDIAVAMAQQQRFLPQELSMLMHSFARLQQTLPESSALALFEACGPLWPRFGPLSLSTLSWAAARLEGHGIQPPATWVQSMLHYSRQHMGAMTDLQLVNLVYGVAKLRARPSTGWMRTVLSETTSRLPLSSARLHSTFAWSLGTLRFRPSSTWLAAFVTSMSRSSKHMSWQALSMALWGIGVLRPGAAGREACRQMLERAREIMTADKKLDSLTSQGFAMMIWSCVRMHVAPPISWLRPFFLHSGPTLGDFKPQELSLIIWGLARMKVRPPQQWFSQFEAACRSNLPQARSQHVSLMLYGFARLRYDPSVYFWQDALTRLGILGTNGPAVNLLTGCELVPGSSIGELTALSSIDIAGESGDLHAQEARAVLSIDVAGDSGRVHAQEVAAGSSVDAAGGSRHVYAQEDMAVASTANAACLGGNGYAEGEADTALSIDAAVNGWHRLLHEDMAGNGRQIRAQEVMSLSSSVDVASTSSEEELVGRWILGASSTGRYRPTVDGMTNTVNMHSSSRYLHGQGKSMANTADLTLLRMPADVNVSWSNKGETSGSQSTSQEFTGDTYIGGNSVAGSGVFGGSRSESDLTGSQPVNNDPPTSSSQRSSLFEVIPQSQQSQTPGLSSSSSSNGSSHSGSGNGSTSSSLAVVDGSSRDSSGNGSNGFSSTSGRKSSSGSSDSATVRSSSGSGSSTVDCSSSSGDGSSEMTSSGSSDSATVSSSSSSEMTSSSGIAIRSGISTAASRQLPLADESTSEASPLDTLEASQGINPTPLSPRDLVFVIWSLASLRQHPGQSTLVYLSRSLQNHLHNMSHVELAMLVWSMAGLQAEPGADWCNAFVAAATTQLPVSSLLSVSTFIVCIPKLGPKPDPRFLVAAQAAFDRELNRPGATYAQKSKAVEAVQAAVNNTW